MRDDKTPKSSQAADIFLQGFSCSQAVLAAFGESYGLDRNLALRISQSFGGGIAHLGQMCGAVSGSLMVLGLVFGRTCAEDDQAKSRTYRAVREFMKEFKEKHGSLICRDLLGYDIDDPQDYEKIKEEKLFSQLCPNFVESAGAILEKMLSSPQKNE